MKFNFKNGNLEFNLKKDNFEKGTLRKSHITGF